jgi:threonine aldolase
VASLLGKEAALFVPSGTMGNQICIKLHTRPGDEVIAEQGSHVFNYETGGAAFHSAVQMHTVEGTHGLPDPAAVKRAIRPPLYYMPRTSLLCLENTHNRAGGTVLPLDGMRELRTIALDHGMAVHLDGARIWNAAVVSGIRPAEYASVADTVSVCFSKGLGAPVGSAIAGTRAFLTEARKLRKIFGGGMRQAGVLAAACLYALDHNMERLAEDHASLRALADLLAARGVPVDMAAVQSNILLLGLGDRHPPVDEVLDRLRGRGVLLTPGMHRGLRAVTHLDVTREQVLEAGEIIAGVLA